LALNSNHALVSEIIQGVQNKLMGQNHPMKSLTDILIIKKIICMFIKEACEVSNLGI